MRSLSRRSIDRITFVLEQVGMIFIDRGFTFKNLQSISNQYLPITTLCNIHRICSSSRGGVIKIGKKVLYSHYCCVRSFIDPKIEALVKLPLVLRLSGILLKNVLSGDQ